VWTGPTIAVFGMTCIKPQVDCKRLVLGLLLYEFNATVDDQVRFVTQSSVGQLFEKGIATDVFEYIKVIAGFVSGR
jgi:hypothetical protein